MLLPHAALDPSAEALHPLPADTRRADEADLRDFFALHTGERVSPVSPAASTSPTFPINTYRSRVTQVAAIMATQGPGVLTVPPTITGR